MLALIGIVLALLVGLTVLGMVIAIIGAIVRLLMLLGMAGGIAVAVGLAFSAAGADGGPAILMGLLAFPAAIWLLRHRSRARPQVQAGPADIEPAPALSVTYSGPAEAKADAAIGAAWEELAAMLPPARTGPLFEARATCVEVLQLATAAEIDLDLFACAAFIRRNVPELALRNARLWAAADAPGRAALTQGIAEDIARLGAYARRELDRTALYERRADRDGLAALRLHIAARTDG